MPAYPHAPPDPAPAEPVLAPADPPADTFVFDLHAPVYRFTDEQLVDALRRFAALSGNVSFSVAQFNRWRDRPCNALTIFHRFGGWPAALARIGITHVRPEPRAYDADDLIRNLETVWRHVGRRPGLAHLKRHGTLPIGAYYRHWGGLIDACRALVAWHQGRITREELLRPRAPAPPRKAIPLDVRWRILKRDAYRCVVCGRSPATDRAVELHVDHIVPVARRGGNEETNLRTLCAQCNGGKRDSPP